MSSTFDPAAPKAVFGSTCRDGGTCHHGCRSPTGCFREDGCSPLTLSGLDNQWRTPQEAARDEAALIEAQTPDAPARARKFGL